MPCGRINGGFSWNPGYAWQGSYEAWLKDGKASGPIDVTKINAPIFAASGGKDDIWTKITGLSPDSINVEKILEKRTKHNDAKLHLDNSGHNLWDEKNNP